MSERRSGVKAIINSPYFKFALMLPFLVCEVIRERDYYHAHGGFSLAPILLALMFATMAVASLFYWLVAAIRRGMGK